MFECRVLYVPCLDVITSHVAVLLCGDLFHFVLEDARRSHTVSTQADARYAPRLAPIVVLEPAQRVRRGWLTTGGQLFKIAQDCRCPG